MKILIINLPRYNGSSVTREGRCELIMHYRIDTPATLLIIASILRENYYQINFIDANGLNLSYQSISELLISKKFDIVIFTIAAAIIEHDIRICDIIKNLNPSCITIGYSWYARNFGKELLNEYPNLDILIIDDPFSIIKNLIQYIENNRDLTNVRGIVYRDNSKNIKINPILDEKINFDDLPIPAYDLLQTFKPYYIYTPLLKPYALIYAGKGCPFGCKYCNVARTKYSGRSAKSIIKELKLLKKLGNIKYVWFFDEIFTINRKRVIEVCKGIIEEKLKIKWLCDSRVDLVDEKLLRLMRRAGCIGISYGVESGSQRILNAMNKGITIEQAKKALMWTRKAHIPIQLNLILGYIGENAKSINETEMFIKSALPEFLQVTKMMALNDTEFNKLALEKGWINESTNWNEIMKSTKKKIINYKPFNLDLWGERKKLYRMLYYNPKWWFIVINTLLRNHNLLLPMIGTLVTRFFNKNVI